MTTMIRSYNLELQVSRHHIYRYRYMTVGPVRGERGEILSIALIHVDHANFEFPTDVPSGAFCRCRYIFHESHDTFIAQNQQETVEAGLDGQSRPVVTNLLVAVIRLHV